jgi:3-hydroxyisobutyrate dehydrogenase-like beta-hydroxyacid dehydrogenase
MSMDVGFMGLGAMGGGVAGNLLRAGHRLLIWNRSAAPVDRLVAQGALRAGSPPEAASASIFFSMLPEDSAIRSVFIEGGLLERLKPGAIHVNLATISVSFAREFAALHRRRGVGYVAAPVLGRPDVAAAGKLNIMAAGASADIERVQPLLDAIGQKTWRFGEEPERANAVKLAANFMIASALQTMAEATALLRAHDIAASDFLEIATSTLFAAPVYQGYGKLIADERYAPAGFKLRLGLKDIRLALEAADKVHVPMPFASVLKDNFLDAMAQGDGDLDWSALAKVALRRAGRS